MRTYGNVASTNTIICVGIFGVGVSKKYLNIFYGGSMLRALNQRQMIWKQFQSSYRASQRVLMVKSNTRIITA